MVIQESGSVAKALIKSKQSTPVNISKLSSLARSRVSSSRGGTAPEQVTVKEVPIVVEAATGPTGPTTPRTKVVTSISKAQLPETGEAVQLAPGIRAKRTGQEAMASGTLQLRGLSRQQAERLVTRATTVRAEEQPQEFVGPKQPTAADVIAITDKARPALRPPLQRARIGTTREPELVGPPEPIREIVTITPEGRIERKVRVTEPSRGFRNVAAVGKEIGTNIIQGDFLKPATVAPRFRGTPLGKVAGIVSTPAFILGAPAIVAGTTVLATSATSKALFASKAARLTLGRAAAKATPKAVAAARTAGLQEFGKGLAGGVARGLAIPAATKGISQLTAPKAQRDIITTPEFKGIFSRSFAAETAAVREQGIIRGLAFEISPFFSSSKETFETTARAEFKSQGLTGTELETAVKAAKRQRKAAAIGEGAALLSISQLSEGVGRRGVVQAFKGAAAKGTTVTQKKAFGKLFSLTAGPIARAGVIEGASQEIAQQTARAEDLTVKERLSKIGLMGAFGGVSAGVIGGTIAASKLGAPAVSKTIEVASFISDPFEKPGDILQDITEVASRKLFGKVAPTPAIFRAAPKPGEVISFGVKGAASKVAAKVAKVSVPVPVFSLGITPTPTPTTTTTQTKTPRGKAVTPSQTLDTILTNAPIKTPTPISISILTPTPVPAPAPTPSAVQTPTQTPTDTTIQSIISSQTQTPTPVSTTITAPTTINAPVSLFTNVPVNVPVARIPPPLPLAFPLGAGKVGTRRGKRTKFISELAISRKILTSLVDIGKPAKKKRQAETRQHKIGRLVGELSATIGPSKKAKKKEKKKAKRGFSPLGPRPVLPTDIISNLFRL